MLRPFLTRTCRFEYATATTHFCLLPLPDGAKSCPTFWYEYEQSWTEMPRCACPVCPPPPLLDPPASRPEGSLTTESRLGTLVMRTMRPFILGRLNIGRFLYPPPLVPLRLLSLRRQSLPPPSSLSCPPSTRTLYLGNLTIICILPACLASDGSLGVTLSSHSSTRRGGSRPRPAHIYIGFTCRVPDDQRTSGTTSSPVPVPEDSRPTAGQLGESCPVPRSAASSLSPSPSPSP